MTVNLQNPLIIQYRVAATNPRKLPVVEGLLARHREDNVLIIGQYLDRIGISILGTFEK